MSANTELKLWYVAASYMVSGMYAEMNYPQVSELISCSQAAGIDFLASCTAKSIT